LPTTTERRVVFDTNALVSYLLAVQSVSGRAVRRATNEAIILASAETLEELADVLSRPKFDPYVSLEARKDFLKLIARSVEMVSVIGKIRACRDSKDDKFLELAAGGRADMIVTGDKDLLTLHPFHGVSIMTPARYLEL
jgi:putative PIN family toxin of toxin-antitoxin system